MHILSTLAASFVAFTGVQCLGLNFPGNAALSVAPVLALAAPVAALGPRKEQVEAADRCRSIDPAQCMQD
ncbi:uncharacterized protein CTRU02_200169 [Colletotrichum truncatum]|uniref:Uncharacterized protein n=1 Tax=Colletotrichum truncatum TaxID=5467 RepID=A0ACC3ZDP6_COLTU|nr:uncharacterized protein CTRU02_05045 [Colletotrichum truncatum]KAF6794844.1 hypothetical protein CTRU02_05045 [Colletotrichum truncatum]